MARDNQDLTKGPLARKILFFSAPLIVSNLLQVLFNVADIAVVGRFAGASALGSVGSTTILVTMFTSFLIGVSGGINVLTALYLGSGDRKGVRETVHSAFLFSILTGLTLLLIGAIFSKGILELLNTKPELIDGAVLYIRIYFLGMPALAVYNFGNAVFSAAGDTKRPLKYLSMAGVVNIILNLFFVIVCKMDVAGVAVSSIISQYLSAAMISVALFRSGDIYGLHRSELRLNRNKTVNIIRIGIPAGLQNAIFQIANLFVQAGVNSFDATMVAGNAAAANADALVYDVMTAFYTACGSFMGQNFGAGNRKRVRNSYLISLAYSFGIGMIMGLGLVLFGHQFLSLFSTDADDPIVHYGCLLWIFCFYGLYHHGFQSFGKEYDTDGDRYHRFLRIQSCLDLYSFCVFSYHIIPVFPLYIFMGDHSHCRNHLFCLHLQKKSVLRLTLFYCV